MSGVYQDLGNWEAAKKSVNKALELIQTVDGGLLYAQILNTSGSLQLKTGNHQIALDNWKQSEQIYRKFKDDIGYANKVYLERFEVALDHKVEQTSDEIDFGKIFLFNLIILIGGVLIYQRGKRHRTKSIAILLSLLFGIFGWQKFYLGQKSKGIYST